RYVSLTADYKLQDNFSGWNYLSITARQGLPILGSSNKDDDLLSRQDAPQNFSLLDFSFSRLQKLSDIWSVKISATGQWASGPLLISQQFYLGDSAYGPGFYSGDSGIAGYGEIRFDQTVSNDILKGFQLYGFFDKGAVWSFNNNGQILSIASTGAAFVSFSRINGKLPSGLPFPFMLARVQTTFTTCACYFRYRLLSSCVRPERRCIA